MEYALEVKNLTKAFGTKVIANKNVSLHLNKGEILALLGENGSGKTTLMNMVAGIYQPDKGQIFVNGKEVNIKTPRDAINHKIGMIHQHFKLVDVFTAAENIILGNDGEKSIYNLEEVNSKVQKIIDEYGFTLSPTKKIYEMSVSEKQTVEIIKVLYRGADILILDEPTAVLTPQENEKLFAIIKTMAKIGKSIILITHKLNEVMEVSDRVVVLRKGEYVGEMTTKDATESKLSELIVGKSAQFDIPQKTYDNKTLKLKVKNLSITNNDKFSILSDINFEAYGGEILGIAGISGSGQKELLEAIAGLQKLDKGSDLIFYEEDTNNKLTEVDLTGLSPKEIIQKGIVLSFVPEDRLGMGLVGSMNIIDNIMLKSFENKHELLLDTKESKKLAEKIVQELEVVTPDIDKTPLKNLSGGNVQKILVGREIETKPKLLMSAYAVRGLDINTSYTIYNLLIEEKMNGVAVIYVGEDLDVLLQLSDRVMILCDGKVSGIFPSKELTKEKVGLYMTKLGG